MQEVQAVQEQMSGRYAMWFVAGAWWAVSLEGDGVVVEPEGPPAWPAPCAN